MSFTTALLCPHSSGVKCGCKLLSVGTSIFTAAEYGQIDVIERKFKRIGAGEGKWRSLDVADGAGYTMLHYAAQHDQRCVVEWILASGGSVDPSVCGATPLHRASFRGNYEVCTMLLDRGANPNALDTSFGDLRTPLHKAYSQKKNDVVALLLSRGADPNICDAQGKRYDQLLAYGGEEGITSAKAVLCAVCPPAMPEQKYGEKKASIENRNKRANSVSGAECTGCNTVALCWDRSRCCGALYCGACVQKWRASRSLCPQCRNV